VNGTQALSDAEVLDKLRKGSNVRPSKHTFEVSAAEGLAARHQLRPRTLEVYEIAIRRHLNPVLRVLSREQIGQRLDAAPAGYRPVIHDGGADRDARRRPPRPHLRRQADRRGRLVEPKTPQAGDRAGADAGAGAARAPDGEPLQGRRAACLPLVDGRVLGASNLTRRARQGARAGRARQAPLPRSAPHLRLAANRRGAERGVRRTADGARLPRSSPCASTRTSGTRRSTRARRARRPSTPSTWARVDIFRVDIAPNAATGDTRERVGNSVSGDFR